MNLAGLHGAMTDAEAGALALAALAGLAPTWLFLRGRSLSPFPLIALTGLFYVVFFALPPFFVDLTWWTVGFYPRESGMGFGIEIDRIGPVAALIVLFGVMALMVGYFLVAALLPEAAPRLSLPRAPAPWIDAMAWLLAAAFVVFLYLPPLRDQSMVAQAMLPLGYVALGWLTLVACRGRLTRLGIIVFACAVLPAIVAAHVRAGLVTPAILLVVFLLTIFLVATRRVTGFVVASAVCAVLIFPAMKLSVLPQFGLRETTVEYSGNDPLSRILRRIALTVTLEHVTRLTPGKIPFRQGGSFKNLLTNSVPRLIWPDKPREQLGQWFGHEYRLLNPDDTGTSINLPWLIEFYINFGFPGVMLGMATAGALLALLEWAMLRSAAGELELIVGWALLFPLTFQASNVSLMLGGLPTQIVFVYAFVAALLAIMSRIAKKDAVTSDAVQ